MITLLLPHAIRQLLPDHGQLTADIEPRAERLVELAVADGNDMAAVPVGQDDQLAGAE